MTMCADPGLQRSLARRSGGGLLPHSLPLQGLQRRQVLANQRADPFGKRSQLRIASGGHHRFMHAQRFLMTCDLISDEGLVEIEPMLDAHMPQSDTETVVQDIRWPNPRRGGQRRELLG